MGFEHPLTSAYPILPKTTDLFKTIANFFFKAYPYNIVKPSQHRQS